jgi:IS5 family transposase
VPAVERHIALFGAAPQLVATDRGFFSNEAEAKLRELGVATIVLLKPGYKSKERIEHESRRAFRRGRAWRAGGEARIAHLKHDFGMKRSRSKGSTGIFRSIHWAAIANLHVIARRGPPVTQRIAEIRTLGFGGSAPACALRGRSAVRAARPEWATYAQGARLVAKTSKRCPSGPRRG